MLPRGATDRIVVLQHCHSLLCGQIGVGEDGGGVGFSGVCTELCLGPKEARKAPCTRAGLRSSKRGLQKVD